jgi:branched-chain amino acid transport system substrate-binding protein
MACRTWGGHRTPLVIVIPGEGTMRKTTRVLPVATSLVAGLFYLSNSAMAEPTLTGDAPGNEIRIGTIMPYTGPLAAFSSIGRAEAAYFEMINERGGVNGRKVKLIAYDDSSDPAAAIEHAHKLVEIDQVLLVFGAFGTPSNLALRPYLNEKQVPHLFVASGDDAWNAPDAFPWTMGWQPQSRREGRIYANYIKAYYPDRKIAVLWQNDQFGRDMLRGLEESLGDGARMIVSDTTFDISDKTINTQIDLLHSSGAEILAFDGSPAVAALALRQMAEIGWQPVFLLDNASASIANALRPAGLENSIGVITTEFLKDPGDPAWKDDAEMKEWKSFMDKYYPEGDQSDINAVFGYAAAATLVEVLTRCGDDLSRENIMQQAEGLDVFPVPLALKGITASTGPNDFRPIKQLRLVQFDGESWQPIGDVIDSAFQEK